jgi:transposase
MALAQARKAIGGGAYSAEIRWLVVWKRLGKGESHHTVTLELEGISKSCQNDILDRFQETGDIETWQGRRAGAPPNQVINGADDIWLLGNVLDDPSATLCMRTATFRRVRGKTVHLSSICRALHRLGLSHGRLQHCEGS